MRPVGDAIIPGIAFEPRHERHRAERVGRRRHVARCRGYAGAGGAVERLRARARLGPECGDERGGAYFRDGTLEAVACFPELPSLAERGLADAVSNLYCQMAERGELFQAGRRVSDVAALLRECLERWGRPVAISCDRWRLAELKEKLEAVRFPLAELVERGQGFKDGGQDVRDFRAAVLGDHVRPSQSLLLRAAMSEARVTGDPSGNWKLAKHVQGGRRANARDDACAAAIVAVAAGYRLWTAKPRQRRWRYWGAA